MYKLYMMVKYLIKNYLLSFTNHIYIMRNIADPQLRSISIETINRCNGLCSFCPVNANEPQRPYAKMTTELFEKIILELSAKDYKGSISIFQNNEPFLDERIIDFHRFARSELPNASFILFTNGSLLNLSKFLDIINYLDELVIDNYNDSLQVNSSLKEVYDYLEKHNELKSKVHFSFRLQNEVLTSRAGQAPNKKDVKYLRSPCLFPYEQMTVRPTGEVSLCCNDALGKCTLGNLNNNTIWEVWESENYKKFRHEMYKNGRKNLLLCKNCDVPTHHLHLPAWLLSINQKIRTKMNMNGKA